jgi:purine nucleosidase
MLSWEATVRYPFSWEQYEALAAGTSRAAEFFHDTTGSAVAFLRETLHAPGFFIPDPLAMAAALEPDLVEEDSFHYVTVETRGVLTRGQTVTDHFGASGHAPNVHVIKKLDIAAVYRMFEHMLS